MAQPILYENVVEIYEMFLSNISDDLYINVYTTDYERFLDLEALLTVAIGSFKGCKIPIKFQTDIGPGPEPYKGYGKLDQPLTNDEVVVLLGYMEAQYQKRKLLELSQGMDVILDSGIKRQSVSQNMKTLTALMDQSVRRAQTLNRQYTKDLQINNMEHWY